MNKPRIVVVGSANTDLSVLSVRLPAPGETVLGSALAQSCGGKGANQAVAAARAGAQVSLVARVGDDDFGHAALRVLAAEGVDTTAVVVDVDAPSGAALIMVDAQGENQISVAPGANGRLCTADVERASSAIAEADAVLAQLEVPLDAVTAALRAARAAGVNAILNPAPAPLEPLTADILDSVSLLTPNCAEAGKLLGVAEVVDPEVAAGDLMALGVGAVALTLGAKGVCLAGPGGCTMIPAAPASVVDTVGAGDCFSAVLAVGLAEGLGLEAAARMAVCAAGLSTEREGAQPAMPHRREIENRLRSVFGVW